MKWRCDERYDDLEKKKVAQGGMKRYRRIVDNAVDV